MAAAIVTGLANVAKITQTQYTRKHSGGLVGDEMYTIQRRGEYDVRKSSVTPDTKPQLNYINQTGRPVGETSVNIGDIIINGESNINMTDFENELRDVIIKLVMSRRLNSKNMRLA